MTVTVARQEENRRAATRPRAVATAAVAPRQSTRTATPASRRSCRPITTVGPSPGKRSTYFVRCQHFTGKRCPTCPSCSLSLLCLSLCLSVRLSLSLSLSLLSPRSFWLCLFRLLHLPFLLPLCLRVHTAGRLPCLPIADDAVDRSMGRALYLILQAASPRPHTRPYLLGLNPTMARSWGGFT